MVHPFGDEIKGRKTPKEIPVEAESNFNKYLKCCDSRERKWVKQRIQGVAEFPEDSKRGWSLSSNHKSV